MASSIKVEDTGLVANPLRDDLGLLGQFFRGIDESTPEGLERAKRHLSNYKKVLLEVFRDYQVDPSSDAHKRASAINDAFARATADDRLLRQLIMDLKQYVGPQDRLDRLRRALQVEESDLKRAQELQVEWLKSMVGFGQRPDIFNVDAKITLRNDWELIQHNLLDADSDTTSYERLLPLAKLKNKIEEVNRLESESNKYRRTVEIRQIPGRRGAEVLEMGPEGNLSVCPNKVLCGTLVLSADDWRGGMTLQRILRSSGALVIAQTELLLPMAAGAGRQAASDPAEMVKVQDDNDNRNYIPPDRFGQLSLLLGAALAPERPDDRVYVFSFNRSADGTGYFMLEGKVVALEILKQIEPASKRQALERAAMPTAKTTADKAVPSKRTSTAGKSKPKK